MPRKSQFTQGDFYEMSCLSEDGLSTADIAEKYEISVQYVRRVLKEQKELDPMGRPLSAPKDAPESDELRRTRYSYDAMLKRCYGDKISEYFEGIEVCARWRDSFGNFLADMGYRPDGFIMRRKDWGKNYDPENCYWGERPEYPRDYLIW